MWVVHILFLWCSLFLPRFSLIVPWFSLIVPRFSLISTWRSLLCQLFSLILAWCLLIFPRCSLIFGWLWFKNHSGNMNIYIYIYMHIVDRADLVDSWLVSIPVHMYIQWRSIVFHRKNCLRWHHKSSGGTTFKQRLMWMDSYNQLDTSRVWKLLEVEVTTQFKPNEAWWNVIWCDMKWYEMKWYDMICVHVCPCVCLCVCV